MSQTIEVKVPDIGDYKDIPVIEVLVKPGDTVDAETPLVTLESDKATMDVPSPSAGVVKDLKLKVGDKVSMGTLVLTLDAAGAAAAPAAAPAPAAAAPAKAAPAPAKTPAAAAPAAAPALAATGGTIEVKVPDIGDYKDIPVIEVLVKAGDTVDAETPLVTLESDKATMDVPSPVAGVIKELKIKVGDKVSKGTLVLTMASAAAPAAATSAPAAAPAKAAAAPATSAPAAGPARAAAPTASLEPMDEASLALAHASPSVRRFARELGAALGKVKGSGPKGRILKEDVQAYVKGELTRPKAAAGGGGLNVAPMPVVDFAKFGPVETQALTRIKKLSGAALHRNWVTIPHVTQLDEADITELEAFRKSQADELKKQGVRLTLIAFLLKACVVALKQYPNFNASLAPDGESLILKKYFHIGVAVDTPLGLVVPVLRDVDKKGLVDLAKELGDISARMRDGKINPADLQGGCFSISSLGGIGGTAFTPIINAPEVAILGVSKGQLKPVWDGKQFVPRLMLPLSLSYDHRVVDGAQGAHFITFLSSVLSDIRRLSL